MLLAFYLMAASSLKVKVTSVVRHPQLTAIKAWSVGHLLVNGDAPSLVLFGGLLAWAVVSVILINRQDGKDPLPAVEVSMPREVFSDCRFCSAVFRRRSGPWLFGLPRLLMPHGISTRYGKHKNSRSMHSPIGMSALQGR